MRKVVVLGAGLTGLSATYHLERTGKFLPYVYEKEKEEGGLLRSIRTQGFTFDYTGHYLHVSDPYFKQFIFSLLSLEKIERRALIFMQNQYSLYPFQKYLKGRSPLLIKEVISGFLKRKKKKNSSYFFPFSEWIRTHFGEGLGKHFFFPYNSKLFSYPLDRIDYSWTGRFVPSISFEEILEGIQKEENDRVGYNGTFWYPPQGGISRLIDSLKSTLTSSILTEHEAIHINVEKKEILFSSGKKENYDVLVSTMPLPILLSMLEGRAARPFKTAVEHLLCNTVVNINIGYPRREEQKAHWIYFPEKQFPFYRMGFWHQVCSANTPSQAGAAYVETSFLPQATSRTMQQKKVAAARRKALDFLKINESEILVEKTLFLHHAYVIYNRWRQKHLSSLLEQLEQLSIHSVGRYGAWKYSSMQEAVLDGREVALKILSCG